MTKEELKKYIYRNQDDIQEEVHEDKYGIYSTGIFKYKGMLVMVTKDNGKWHLSVSAKYPLGYVQIKEVRYMFLPNDIQAAQIFPPREEFVNVHETCYHLFEI